MAKFFLPCSIALLICLAWRPHPFYLSVTDLKYNAPEKSMQGTVKLFTNDLEDALKKKTGKKIDLINDSKDEVVREALYKYIIDHLAIIINSQPQKPVFLGFEPEEEALWVYIELKVEKRPQKILIHNTLLCEYLPQQLNISHIQVDKDQKSLKSSCSDPVQGFEF